MTANEAQPDTLTKDREGYGLLADARFAPAAQRDAEQALLGSPPVGMSAAAGETWTHLRWLVQQRRGAGTEAMHEYFHPVEPATPPPALLPATAADWSAGPPADPPDRPARRTRRKGRGAQAGPANQPDRDRPGP